MRKRKKVAIIASSTGLLTLIGLYITTAAIGTHNQALQDAAKRQQDVQESCMLDPQTFMSTVNTWRATTGAPALTYSTQLEGGAKARIADMSQGQYYGHTNPVTKEQSYTLVMKSDPVATLEDEVLDGQNSVAQSVENFKNSPDHYNALIDPRYHYFGSAAVYEPHSWAEYANDGSLQNAAGTYSANCLVVGELADNSGDVPVANAQTGSVTKAGASVAATKPGTGPPSSGSVGTNPPPVASVSVPTCDTSQQAYWTNIYQQAVSEVNSNIDQQEQSAKARIGSAGGGSDAIGYAISQLEQQRTQQLSQALVGYRQKLTDNHC